MGYAVSMIRAKSVCCQAKTRMIIAKQESKKIPRISQYSNPHFGLRFYKYAHMRRTYRTRPINFKRSYINPFRKKPHQDIVYSPMHDMKDLYYAKAGIMTTILYNY